LDSGKLKINPRLKQWLFANREMLVLQAIGLAFFGFLAYLALHFYKERMVAFDPAFFAYKMTQYHDYSIELGRWGSVFSQVLPLWVMEQGASLKTFLKVYSLSPVLNAYIIFLIVTLALKNIKAGYVLLFTLCLAFGHTFYYTTSELNQSLPLVVLFWALIAPVKPWSSNVKRYVALGVAVLLIYTISYFHQLSLFAMLFVLLVEVVIHKRWKDKELLIIAGLCLLWYVIRIVVLTSTAYEREKMPELSVFFEQVDGIRWWASTKYFKLFAKDYLVTLFLIFGACFGYFCYRKKWLNAAFIFLYPFCFLLLILFTYWDGESPVMLEQYYTLFGLFAAIPFILILYEKLTLKWITLIVVPLLVINLNGIYNAHETPTKRIQYLERITSYGRQFDERKYLISTMNYPWEYTWVTWSLPFETLMYSSLENPDDAVTYFIAWDINGYDDIIGKKNVFLGPEWSPTWFESHNMNKKFFNLPSGGYIKMNSPSTDSTFDLSNFNKDNFRLEAVEDVYYTDFDTIVVPEVKLINKTNYKYHSLKDQGYETYISYRMYNSKGKQIVAEGKRNALEVDIWPNSTYTQGVTVLPPKEDGEYRLEFDLLAFEPGQPPRWMGHVAKCKLVVD
jgi:hypothetical protein